MEQIDQTQAARVWQRVKGTGTVQEQTLAQLLRETREDAEVCWQLSRRMKDREGAALRRLCDQQRSCVMVLRGLCAMSGQEPPRRAVPNTEGESAALLARCCQRMARRQRLYAACSAEGDLAPIYAGLARQEQQCCFQAAELVGRAAGGGEPPQAMRYGRG